MKIKLLLIGLVLMFITLVVHANDNVILNSDFSNGFTDWQPECCWDISVKPSNPDPNDTAAQCDQDALRGEIVGWPVGHSGKIWQDVVVPEHSQIRFKTTEIQHHGNNTAEWRIYGYENNQWIEIWSRLEFGSDVPANTIITRNIWYDNEYVIYANYDLYRVEATCYIEACLAENQQCGWKFTHLELIGEN